MLDWDDLRYFLAVSRHGTLSAAGRVLAVTQPTVGRRLEAFERRLGARLFDRTPTRLVLTATGHTILAHVERMETEANSAERSASGRDEGLRGTVRITASEWIAVRLLGAALAPFLERNAGLSFDLVADARHLNLARREADLAIRPSAFLLRTIYQRRIGRVEFGLYASNAYLARHGDSALTDRGAGHKLIAMADGVGDVARAWLATHAKHATVVVRTNGREQMATLAAAGLGLACLPRIVGDATTGLRLLPTPVPPPTRSLWLGVHRDMRTIPRVRATITALVGAVQHLSALAPGEQSPPRF
jgi:DNA-binding transcriptional LysR family regulator